MCVSIVCVSVLSVRGVCARLFMASPIAWRPVSLEDRGFYLQERQEGSVGTAGQSSGLSTTLHSVSSRILEGQTGSADVGGA